MSGTWSHTDIIQPNSVVTGRLRTCRHTRAGAHALPTQPPPCVQRLPPLPSWPPCLPVRHSSLQAGTWRSRGRCCSPRPGSCRRGRRSSGAEQRRVTRRAARGPPTHRARCPRRALAAGQTTHYWVSSRSGNRVRSVLAMKEPRNCSTGELPAHTYTQEQQGGARACKCVRCCNTPAWRECWAAGAVSPLPPLTRHVGKGRN